MNSSRLFEIDRVEPDFAFNFLTSAQIYDRSIVNEDDVRTINTNANVQNNIA